ncbi:phloem protein 2-A7 [Arabidopsis thaliana]|uniref:Phloem protein 2-A7 n=1 Tax=Arabidopsis thaliana TaxID=3702 RepID=A0A1P8BA23_ARATH|nr:phloem protein 2-A7 [Arabidopsis thaliana]ANM68446.1 phloem protein 2-A7 [Arabidopsis thaliana]|eukprot:NP_001330203.1 phloem protein 2-A7 [Arabidopsis thaliana]
MAASTFSSSSSFVGLIPSRPLVFIKSQEEDVSKGLINFLEPVLQNKNINVFIDEEEVRGKGLKNLFKRIQDSKISLAIFSESKCDFNDLLKNNESADEAIPIFYKVDATGDLADLQNSVKCKKDLINSAVEEMSKLLANISVGVYREKEANSKCFMVPARKLQMSHSEKLINWTWSSIYETPNDAAIEVAMLNEVHWLHMSGNFHTRNLTPGTKYEVVFLVSLDDTSSGWEQPVNLNLKVINPDGTESLQERETSLECHIGENWVDIQAGVLVAPPRNAAAKMTFTMYQYVTSDRKSGLVVKGVAIRPMQ